jgi:dipeptidyl aminopeptidase/acylaminoacyl peptidase
VKPIIVGGLMMPKRSPFMYLFAFLLAGSLHPAVARECFTGSDLLRVRMAAEPVISPSGAWIAYVIIEPPDTSKGEGRDQSDIWVVDFEGERGPRRFAFGPANEYSPLFSPDGRWIAFLSDRDGDTEIYAIGIDGGEARRVTDFDGVASFFAWSPAGDRLAVVVTEPVPGEIERARERGDDERVADRDERYARLWIVDVETGGGQALTPQDLHVQSAAWSPDGSMLALVTSAGPTADEMYYRSRLELLELPDGRRRELCGQVAGPPRWSPDGGSIACMYNMEHPEVTVAVPVVSVVDIASGERRLLGVNHPGTLRSPRWLGGGERLAVIELSGVKRRLAALSVEKDEVDVIEEILGPYYGGAPYDLSRDGSKIAMLKGSADRPPDVWAKELGFLKKTRRLTDLNAWLEDLSLPGMRPVRWKSRDGTEIEGVLVLPPDYRKDVSYPAVLEVHGGPMWAWWLGWHGTWHEWALALACKGFVVLLPNPRGSLGYGVGFARANFDDWGGGDFEDIVTGADYLIDEGYADPDRIGICGWSYGGYMSSWAITQTRRFAAAVVGAGVTNLYSFHGTTDVTPTFLEKYFREVAYLRAEAYRSHSAMNDIANAETPTLILHGEDDVRVPVGQAWELYRGLVQTGSTAELVLYPGEGHGFEGIYHRIDVVERIVEWFERHLSL